MGEVLNYIAEKTYAKCYKSYKYCYDSVANPNLLYDSSDNYINLKQFAETIKDPEPKDMRPICNSIHDPLFNFFLDGSRRVYKVDDISMNANGKVYLCMIMKRLTVFLLLFVWLGNKTYSQVNDTFFVDNIDTLCTIVDFNIKGNTKTKVNVILCELEFNIGDIVPVEKLPVLLEKSKDNLLKTSLFNYVTLTPNVQDSSCNSVVIDIILEERWYVWPGFRLRPYNGNLNDWLTDPDFSLLNYQFTLYKDNFRGRREIVAVKVFKGFDNVYKLGYKNVALDYKRNHLLAFWLSYVDQKSITIGHSDNIAINSVLQNAIKEQYYEITYTYRPSIEITHNVSIEYHSTSVCDSVVILNPYYLGKDNKSIRGCILNYEMKLNKRNSNAYPLRGYMATLFFSQKGMFSKTYSAFMWYYDFRKYCQMADRLYFASKLYMSFSTKGMPFYMMQSIGNSPHIIRGYEHNRITGRNMMYANTSYKWEIVKPRIKKSKRNLMPKFDKIHYAIYMNSFINAGYVSSNPDDNVLNNYMNNAFLWSVGTGIDFVTYYDGLLSGYVAYNAQGKTYFGIGFTTAF